MLESAIMFGLVFMLMCVAFALVHSWRSQRVTLLDWAVLGLGGVYGGAWALVVFVTHRGDNPVWERWLLPFEHLYPVHTLSAIILLGSVCLGWIFGGALPSRPYRSSHVPLVRINIRLIWAGWILLLSAVFMQWFYARAFGGFMAVLEYSEGIRSGVFKVDNPLSFLRPFGGLVLFSSFVFFALWRGGCRCWHVRLGFFLAFAFSLYVLFSWLGRISFVTYLATFVLSVLLERKVRPLSLLMCGGLTMLFIVVCVYQVSVWLNLKAADNLVVFLTRELSFPFVSFFAQLNSGKHLTRGFRDLLVAPVYLLPSSWWTNWVESVGQINTAVIMGAKKGEAGVTGAIPLDLMTLGLMQASVLGIVMVGALFGFGLRVIQFLLDRIRNLHVRAVFEAYIAIKLAVLAVFYSQPALVVSGNFGLLVAVVIIVIFVKTPQVRLRK